VISVEVMFFFAISTTLLLGCQTALQPPNPAVASASSAGIQEISKVFSQLEKTWNDSRRRIKLYAQSAANTSASGSKDLKVE